MFAAVAGEATVVSRSRLLLVVVPVRSTYGGGWQRWAGGPCQTGGAGGACTTSSRGSCSGNRGGVADHVSTPTESAISAAVQDQLHRWPSRRRFHAPRGCTTRTSSLTVIQLRDGHVDTSPTYL